MVDGCRIKQELSLSLFGFKRVHDCVRIWKGGDWAELAFAKTSGIVTGWDALASFFFLSPVTVPEGFVTVNSAQFLPISKVATLILILGWHYFRVAPMFFIKL